MVALSYRLSYSVSNGLYAYLEVRDRCEFNGATVDASYKVDSDAVILREVVHVDLYGTKTEQSST